MRLATSQLVKAGDDQIREISGLPGGNNFRSPALHPWPRQIEEVDALPGATAVTTTRKAAPIIMIATMNGNRYNHRSSSHA